MKNGKFSVSITLPHLKNPELLLFAANKLLDNDITNFKVLVNSEYGILEINDKLKPYIELIGENEPNKLFDIIERCDFILALLDSSNDWQREHYGTGTMSGTVMLSLGFGKILLLESFFAKPLKLNGKTAILYEGQDLYIAMKMAIEMTSEEYDNLQINLGLEAKRQYEQSLHDIQDIITRTQHGEFEKLFYKFIFKEKTKLFKNYIKMIRKKLKIKSKLKNIFNKLGGHF